MQNAIDPVKFDVSLLDFMRIDEFVGILRKKTSNNYELLWHAAKTLAIQVKSSKALLSFSSQLCAGKSKVEVLDKFVDAMKFSLKADHVFILEYRREDNCLTVTHSDCISANNIRIQKDANIEGKAFTNCVTYNQIVEVGAETNP